MGGGGVGTDIDACLLAAGERALAGCSVSVARGGAAFKPGRCTRGLRPPVLSQASPHRPLAIRDEKGSFIFGQPPREWLRLVFAHPRLWRWATILFIIGVVVTVFGLAMLTSLLQDAGDSAFSLLSLVAFAFGAVLWVICLAFRLSIDPWAAQETAKTDVLPEFYVPLTRWTGVLFVLYTVLAFSGLAAYGGAVLTTPVLPHWVGWTAIVYALAGLALLGVTKDAPPLLHHVLPLVMGVLLLVQ
jgi:hypothetical protein